MKSSFIKMFIYLCLSMLAHASQSAPKKTPLIKALQEAKKHTTAQAADLQEIAQRFIFVAWPEYPQPGVRSTEQSLYPTSSVNEASVEALFGSEGLNVDANLLAYLKGFYFYFEYCTKRERAAQILTLAKKYGIDYQAILQKASWNALIAQVEQKHKGPLNYATIKPAQDGWDAVSSALSATFIFEGKSTSEFWQLLTTTSFWTAFALTSQDLQTSLFWQDYLKVLITKSFELDRQLLVMRHYNEQQLFRYIPYLETAYYLPDFTQQRYTAELSELALLLNERTRERLLAQSVEWGALRKKGGEGYDYSKIIKAAECFRQSHFYQVLQTLSHPDCNAILFAPCDPACDPLCSTPSAASMGCKDTPFTKKADGKIGFQPIALPAPYKHEMLFLSMAITLQTLTYNVFKQENLEKTLQVLSKSSLAPTPSILPYTVDDGIYLEDWAALSTGLPEAAQATAAAQQAQMMVAPSSFGASFDNEKVSPQGFVDWVEHVGGNISKDFSHATDALFATAKDISNIAVDEGKVIYYQSGLATIIQNMPPSQAAQMAATYKAAVDHDFKNFGTDVNHLVTNVIKLGQLGGGPLDIILQGVGAVLNDPSLSQDYEKMLDTVASAIGTLVGGSAELIGDVAFKLTTDAVVTLADAIVVVATAGTEGTSAFVNDWTFIGRDIVSSMLETIVVGGAILKDVIKDLIQAVGYLIKLMTDAIIDVGAALVAVLNPIAWIQAGGIANYYKQVQAEFDTHKMLISQIVTVGLLLGVTIATGGAGVWLAVGVGATLAFGAFMIVSGAQEDEEIGEGKKAVTEYLENFTIWTRNQEIIGEYMQSALVDQVKEELNAEISNRKIGLGFYENFYNQLFALFDQQQSYALGGYQAQLLQTNDSGAQVGDVGALYGSITNWLNLNPSQGLVLYEPARGHFSQEIAQLPATFTNAAGQQEQKFWFLQSLTKDFAYNGEVPIVFEVRLRPLYLLDSFYVGIGIGGTALNQQEVLTEHKGTVDRYNQSKMVVFKKDNQQGSATLGVYQHSTSSGAADGWLAQNLTTPALVNDLQTGVWYRMRATLAGNNLQVQVWREGDTVPSPVSVAVAPLNQAALVPLSVVYSGAAIEFDVTTPDQSSQIKQIPALYALPSNAGPAQTEAQREQAKAVLFAQLAQPVVGTFAQLKAADTFELIKGHYIYTTAQTAIEQDTGGAVKNDWVILANGSNATGVYAVTNIGLSPQLAASGALPNVVISLITGKVFDENKNVVLYQNVWPAYVKQNELQGSYINTALSKAIEQARAAYAQASKGPYRFGNSMLIAASIKDLLTDHYVYKVVRNGVTDYVILAAIGPDNLVARYGMPYQASDSSVTALISLVTLQVYQATSDVPFVKMNDQFLQIYQQETGPLSDTLLADIATAKKAVTKAAKAAATQQTAQSLGAPSTVTTKGSTIATTGGTPQTTVVPKLTGPSQSSLAAQQTAAATAASGGW